MPGWNSPQRAERYRRTAREIRRLAGSVHFSESRLELMQLAERFDRLAERLREGDPEAPSPSRCAATGDAECCSS